MFAVSAAKPEPPRLTGASVRLVGATKRWGPVAALDGLSIGIEPDRFTVLPDPSGCGKTTCLRFVAGLAAT
jgi:ABC-type Fe3+/spermidine/putrescine transport system ATPase subunit